MISGWWALLIPLALCGGYWLGWRMRGEQSVLDSIHRGDLNEQCLIAPDDFSEPSGHGFCVAHQSFVLPGSPKCQRSINLGSPKTR